MHKILCQKLSEEIYLYKILGMFIFNKYVKLNVGYEDNSLQCSNYRYKNTLSLSMGTNYTN